MALKVQKYGGLWGVVSVLDCGCGGLWAWWVNLPVRRRRRKARTKDQFACCLCELALLCSGCVVLSASAYSCRLSTARRIGDVPALYSGLWHQRSAFISPSRCRVCHGPGYVIFAMPFPPFGHCIAPISISDFKFLSHCIADSTATAETVETVETTTLCCFILLLSCSFFFFFFDLSLFSEDRWGQWRVSCAVFLCAVVVVVFVFVVVVFLPGLLFLFASFCSSPDRAFFYTLN